MQTTQFTQRWLNAYQNMCSFLRRLDMEAYSWKTTESRGA
jgi:hypothetical protein